MNGNFRKWMDFYAIRCYFLSMKQTIDLILHEEVKRLLDHFSAVMDLRIVLFNAEGKVIQRGLNRRNSDYCRLMQERLFGHARCQTLDRTKQQESIETRSMVCYKCHAGLCEAIAPVMTEGYPAGFVLIGQFRTISKLPEHVRKACKEPALAGAVEEAFGKLPYISPKKLESLLGMFSLLMDYIVTKEMVALRRDRTLSRIERYIEEHVREEITLDRVAVHVGRSRSTVSHLVRRKLGITFKNLVIDRKLKFAEKRMREHPENSIEEVAAMAGFNDPFYFSRIYRKYRGVPPSDYRRTMKTAPEGK